jgi:hypothetical protein
MIRNIIQANALLSALQTNYYIHSEKAYDDADIGQIGYDDCYCSSSSACISLLSIDAYPNSTSLFHLPHFYRGCYVVEALLQSTLECFYDKQCVDKLTSYFSPSSSMNVTVLDASLPSMYSNDSTIEKLVDNLMIEQWNISSSFENYYNECQPIQCTYTTKTNNDMIYIVTTLFGITGGLITVLKFIVPQLVKFVRKKRQQQQPITGKIKSKRITSVKTDDQFHAVRLTSQMFI